MKNKQCDLQKELANYFNNIAILSFLLGLFFFAGGILYMLVVGFIDPTFEDSLTGTFKPFSYAVYCILAMAFGMSNINNELMDKFIQEKDKNNDSLVNTKSEN